MLNAASLLRVVAVWLLNEKQRHGNVRFGLPCNWKHVSDETGVTPREQERRWKIWIRLPSFSSPWLNLTCFYIFRGNRCFKSVVVKVVTWIYYVITNIGSFSLEIEFISRFKIFFNENLKFCPFLFSC